MLGLGGGSISTYLGRFMPDATIDTVEIDRRRDRGRKEIFRPARDRPRALSRRRRPRVPQPQQGLYDLILVDAYQRRLRAVPPADQGILRAGQGSG